MAERLSPVVSSQFSQAIIIIANAAPPRGNGA